MSSLVTRAKGYEKLSKETKERLSGVSKKTLKKRASEKKTTQKVTATQLGLKGEDVARVVEQTKGDVTSKQLESAAAEKLARETGLKRKTTQRIVTGEIRADDDLVVVQEDGRRTLATKKAADILIAEREQQIARQKQEQKWQKKRQERQIKANLTAQFSQPKTDFFKDRQELYSPFAFTPQEYSIARNITDQEIKRITRKAIVPKTIEKRPEQLQRRPMEKVESALFDIGRGQETIKKRLTKTEQQIVPQELEKQFELLRTEGTATPEQLQTFTIQKDQPILKEAKLTGKQFGLAAGVSVLGISEGVLSFAATAKQFGKDPIKVSRQALDVPQQFKAAKKRFQKEPISAVAAFATQAVLFKKTQDVLLARQPTVVSGGTTLKGVSIKQITPTIKPVKVPKDLQLKGKAGLTFDKTFKVSKEPSGISGTVLKPREVAFTIEKGAFKGTLVTRKTFPVSGKTILELSKGKKTTIYTYKQGGKVADVKTTIFDETGGVLKTTKPTTVPISGKDFFTDIQAGKLLTQKRQTFIQQPKIKTISTKAGKIKISQQGFAAQKVTSARYNFLQKQAVNRFTKKTLTQKVLTRQDVTRISRTTLQKEQVLKAEITRPELKQSFKIIKTKGKAPELKFGKGVSIRADELKQLTTIKKTIDLNQGKLKLSAFYKKKTLPREIIKETQKTSIEFETGIKQEFRGKELALQFAKDKRGSLTLGKPSLLRRTETTIQPLKPTVGVKTFKLPGKIPKISTGIRSKPRVLFTQKPVFEVSQIPITRQVTKPVTRQLTKPVTKTLTKTITKPISTTRPGRPKGLGFLSIEPVLPKLKPTKLVKISKTKKKQKTIIKQYDFEQPVDFTRSAFGAAFNIKPIKTKQAIITGLRV